MFPQSHLKIEPARFSGRLCGDKTKAKNMSTQLKKYKPIFIFLTLFLLCSNIFSQQGWYNLNVSFGGGGIYFKDLNTGIVSGEGVQPYEQWRNHRL